MLATLTSLLFLSRIAYAGQYPSMFDADGFAQYYHQLGDRKFMSIYDNQRIVIEGKVDRIDYRPAGIPGSWIAVDLHLQHAKGRLHRLTLWFARRYEGILKTAPKKIEVACVVRKGVYLPSLWDCETLGEAYPFQDPELGPGY